MMRIHACMYVLTRPDHMYAHAVGVCVYTDVFTYFYTCMHTRACAVVAISGRVGSSPSSRRRRRRRQGQTDTAAGTNQLESGQNETESGQDETDTTGGGQTDTAEEISQPSGNSELSGVYACLCVCTGCGQTKLQVLFQI
jgi:hypothetical protein